MLKENPDNFNDLKELFPKVENDTETEKATILEFPGETFGELIELYEPMQTPIPVPF